MPASLASYAAESPVARTRRARKIYRALVDRYPYAHAELDFETPLQLLLATVLSAQTTDVTVNKVTPTLFSRWPTAEALAAADRAEMEAVLKPTGFFRAKTNSVITLSQALVDRFGGEVPARLTDLVTLPGVGRKTANVVLGNAFGVPGITVDTHFGRLSRRFGWTEESDPVKVEHAVAALFPRKDWVMLSHVLIFHGRRTCHARRPACGRIPTARPADPFFTPLRYRPNGALAGAACFARAPVWRKHHLPAETSREWRWADHQPGRKVLLLTSLPGSGHIPKALAAGASGYVVKSMSAAQLIDAIRSVASGHTVIDPQLAADALRSGPSPLTTREVQLLQLVEQGLATESIARAMFLTRGTVRNYLSTIMTKMDVTTRAQAVAAARGNGWL